MSLSNPNPVSTKAGIALSADARHKLQQLADWMELEIMGNQDPRIRLSYLGGITAIERTEITFVSPFGALVQMFEPFHRGDAQLISGSHMTYRIVTSKLHSRVARILDITEQEHFYQVLRYVYYSGGPQLLDVIKTLRTLK